MIIDFNTHNHLHAVAEYLGPAATESDAADCVGNLIEAGWIGWDLEDIPEAVVFLAALGGPTPGPEDE